MGRQATFSGMVTFCLLISNHVYSVFWNQSLSNIPSSIYDHYIPSIPFSFICVPGMCTTLNITITCNEALFRHRMISYSFLDSIVCYFGIFICDKNSSAQTSAPFLITLYMHATRFSVLF